jgi:hypothetical protein
MSFLNSLIHDPKYQTIEPLAPEEIADSGIIISHLIDSDEGWSLYLSLEDTEKLDEVRKALLGEDLKRAAQLARVFELIPVRNAVNPSSAAPKD